MTPEYEITKEEALHRLDYFLSIVTDAGSKIMSDDARTIIVLPHGTRYTLSIMPEEIDLSSVLGMLPTREEN